jgi:hypothetical protein
MILLRMALSQQNLLHLSQLIMLEIVDLETKVRCIEVDYDILNDVCKAVDTIATDKAFNELEEAMLNTNMCPSGNCEA